MKTDRVYLLSGQRALSSTIASACNNNNRAILSNSNVPIEWKIGRVVRIIPREINRK